MWRQMSTGPNPLWAAQSMKVSWIAGQSDGGAKESTSPVPANAESAFFHTAQPG